MALHPDFPPSPYAPLIPEPRWFPADEARRSPAYEKLLPPLVAKVRQEVHAWRSNGYLGAASTSVAWLKQWGAAATAAEENGQQYDFVFVDQNGFEKHMPKTFDSVAASFTDDQG